ncbi:MAG: alpha/beta hydrolase [Pseudomonadota bacterium]
MTQLLAESADGTAINSESYGSGRALVVLSGALFAAERWLNVVKILAEKRCVYLVDRRGRGKSGDTAPYAPEREVEDVLAVLNAIPGPIDLLGHSSGAILALRVAARAPSKLERLVVYEPPVFFAQPDLIAQDLPERLQALLARGQRELAVETFLREGPRNSEDSLRGLKQSAAWAPLVATLGHTVPYDSHVQRAFTADPAELARIQIPTLMLVGSASPERMRSGAKTIATRLPNAELRELPDQQHMAMIQAPTLFAGVVDAFLVET